MPDTSPAARWLMAEFEATCADEIGTDSYNPLWDEWTRPVHVCPMITFKSVMDVCEPMRVIPADYADPSRWWL